MKRKYWNYLLLCILLAAFWFAPPVLAASQQRNDMLRTTGTDFGAWWENKAGGLENGGGMMYYETAEGQPAYCLSNRKGHPDDVTYVLSDWESFQNIFGKEESEAIKRVLQAGYPMAGAYWKERGLTENDMRGATQIAIWYVQAQFGTDENTGGSWKTGTWGNLGSRDVKGMIDELVRYGLSRGESPVQRNLWVKAEKVEVIGEEMIGSFLICAEGYDSWTAELCGSNGACTVQLEGQQAAKGTSVSGSSQGTFRVSFRFPARYEGELICKVTVSLPEEKSTLLYYHSLDPKAQEMLLLDPGVTVKAEAASDRLKLPPQKYQLKIKKTGEEVRGLEEEDGCGLFLYEAVPLSGIRYGLYAAETLNLPKGTVEAGALIEVKETDQAGEILFEDLCSGSYSLRELEGKDGFIKNEEPVPVEILPGPSEQETVEEEICVSNKRQTVRVTVIKKDAETGKGLEGSVYGLYTGEEVWSPGEAVLSAGTLLETLMTDKEGRGTFSQEIPTGYSYYVRELKAPDGYLLSEERVRFLVPAGQQEEEPVELTVQDYPEDEVLPEEEAPETGEKDRSFWWWLWGVSALFLLAGLCFARKEKEKN